MATDAPIDDQLHLDTPEGGRLTLSLAGPLPRALAYLIDLAVRGLVLAVIAGPLMLFGRGGTGLYLLLLFLLEWFYPVLFEALWQGRTPGKKMIGLAVVHANGAPLTFSGSLVRNLLRTADLFPMFYLTGFVTMLISHRQQRLGDLAADTLVIHASTHADIRNSLRRDHQGAAQAPDWPLDRDDQLTLLAFHDRGARLSEDRRRELAGLGWPDLPPAQALERLQQVARFVVTGDAVGAMPQSGFERRYRPLWDQLADTLTALEKGKTPDAAALRDFPAHYQSLCHQLALARERGYGLALQEYLNALMLRAHRQLYRERTPLLPRLLAFFAVTFPAAVRRQWRWHLISAIGFGGSGLLVLGMILHDPALVHTVIGSDGLANLESMYHPDQAGAQGRDHQDDLMMFGYYIYNNIGIAFRTFAGGLLLGVGALLVMLFNGSFFGAAAGHLALSGGGEPFFTFVIAHGAPELTAIVLAGGAGLRLGWAVLAPGSWSRVEALKRATRDSLPVMYGVLFLLVLAAFIEAFWSPRLFPAEVKYTVGGVCWALLALYLALAGRGRSSGTDTGGSAWT